MTLAAPPLRESYAQTTLICESLSGDAGIVALFAGSDDFDDSFGGLSLWTGGDPGSTEPTVFSIGSSVNWDGLTMTATFDLVEVVITDPNEDPLVLPAGTASFSATLAPIGRPQVLDSWSERFGNWIQKGEETLQERSVEGTLAVDLLTGSGAEYDMGGCSASSTAWSSSNTNPTANVYIRDSLQVTCRWETPDGEVEFEAADGYATVQGFEGESYFYGNWDLSLTSSALEAEVPLYDADTGEEVGVATATATLARAEPLTTRDRVHDRKVDTSGWTLSVEGTLLVTIPSGTTPYVMSDANCDAEDVRVKSIQTKPQGPKLKNDDPSDALPLSIGQTVSVWTVASATEPEAPCIGGGFFSNGISHTGWWTFVGTGGDVTIDTAGSTFDTILGVYLAAGSGFEQVGCADDVFGPGPGEFTLQAALTVTTVTGATYYVQAGGFGPSGSGQLVLGIE